MMDSSAKTRRQRVLVHLIRDETLPNQEALVRALRRRGFGVTQATLSRDLKELRIVRAPTEHGYRYVQARDEESGAPAAEPGGARLRSVAAEEVRSIEANEVAVVIRTLIGRAQGVAVYIDGLRLPDTLGTIAGDDTILVLPKSVRRTSKLKKDLAERFGVDGGP